MISWEPALLMFLLVFCMVDHKPGKPDLLFWLTPLSALLALLPPILPLNYREELLLAAVTPLVIWLLFQDWVFAQLRLSWKEILSWLVMAIIPGLVLGLTDVASWPASLAYGSVLASLLWSVKEKESEPRLLTNFGPLLLIFLLTEAEAGMVSPRSYLGSLISGGFYGLVMAGLVMVLSARLSPLQRSWVALAQVLLTYWITWIAGLSAVTAALVSVSVYAELKLFSEMYPEFQTAHPPVGSRWLRFVFLPLLMLIGWQAHLPLEVGAVLLSGIVLAISLAVGVSARKPSLFILPERLASDLTRSGIILASVIPLAPGFLPGNLGSIIVAAALSGAVILLGPTLLVSARIYRSQLIQSSEEFHRWEIINRPTMPLDNSTEDDED